MRVLMAMGALHRESGVLLALAQREPGLILARCFVLSPQTNSRPFLTLLAQSRGTSTRCGMEPMPRHGMCRDIQRAKGLCFSLEPLASPPSKGSPVGFRLLALTCRENISQDGDICKGVHCPFREGMPGCYLPPKGTFACSEMLENSIFMALLDPKLSRDGSGSGAPMCMEQDSSFLQLEHIAIRNNPPEKPERKPVCRRWLPEPGVPTGEPPCHHSSESPLRSWELPPAAAQPLASVVSPGSQLSPKEVDAQRLLHQTWLYCFYHGAGDKAASSGAWAGSWRASHQRLRSLRHGYALGRPCWSR